MNLCDFGVQSVVVVGLIGLGCSSPAPTRKRPTASPSSIPRVKQRTPASRAAGPTASRPAKAQPQPAVREPTYTDVSYGPHHRNILNVWVAPSDKPTPVVIRFHGGGFMSGRPSAMFLLEEYLKRGISVASITYRFSTEAPYPAQMHDSARGVQFLRSKAAEWKLDPARIGAMGGSAGGGISLWLGFHDDLADPASKDPVARQSTRLSCMAVNNTQTSYDPRFIRQNIPGPGWRAGPVWQLFGLKGPTEDILPAIGKLMEDASPLNHLTRDDPPVRIVFTWDDVTEGLSETPSIHHPRFGRILKARMDKLGIPCHFEFNLPAKETLADLEFFVRYLMPAQGQHALKRP